VGSEVAAVGNSTTELEAVELAIVLSVSCKVRDPGASIAVVGVTISLLSILNQILATYLSVTAGRLGLYLPKQYEYHCKRIITERQYWNTESIQARR